ncbi:hypothetical protein U8326_00245 [Tsuneonella sp. CC-YZS046]|nr:hypothetical protein [Tsuneonella sp. CC-YZS046]WRO66633.1 hypothetical protein U8326_00245 [Tsuneonella sp. CC-YZS046]
MIFHHRYHRVRTPKYRFKTLTIYGKVGVMISTPLFHATKAIY